MKTLSLKDVSPAFPSIEITIDETKNVGAIGFVKMTVLTMVKADSGDLSPSRELELSKIIDEQLA